MFYGRGTGSKRASIQVPALIHLSLAQQAGVHLGRGLNTWSNVHIDDLVDLYSLVIARAQARRLPLRRGGRGPVPGHRRRHQPHARVRREGAPSPGRSPRRSAPSVRMRAATAGCPTAACAPREHAGSDGRRSDSSHRVFLVEATGFEPGDEPARRMRERYGGSRVGRVGAESAAVEGSVPLVYPSALSWSLVPGRRGTRRSHGMTNPGGRR